MLLKKCLLDLCGGVAQGLEHTVHTRGAIGSNPITATNFKGLGKNKERIHYG
jgi:hypothetical protein